MSEAQYWKELRIGDVDADDGAFIMGYKTFERDGQECSAEAGNGAFRAAAGRVAAL